MKTYEKYKDSGIKWIGEIPEHWEIVPIKYSLQIPLTDGPHETPKLHQSGIPFISAESIKNDKIDFSKKRGFISEEEHQRFSLKYRPQLGDVYMIKSGATTGNLARVETEKEFNIWSPLAAFRPAPKKTTTDFLFFYMKSSRFFSAVELGWNYGTQQNIGMNVLENLKMVRPPISEQTAIANYLDKKTAAIDQLIADKKQLVALYQEEKTALINQAVTKGINPEVKLKDSGVEWLGEIPEHWEVKKLKYLIFKAGSGVTPSGGASVYQDEGIPLLRSQNIYSEGLRLDNVAHISEKIHNKMNNSKVFKGDVLLNITGGSIGRVYFISNQFKEANVNQHVCIIRPNHSLITSEFLYYLIRSNIGQNQIAIEQTGGNRDGLNFEALKNFEMPALNIEEQTQIVQHIEKESARIDAKITKAEKYIKLLTEYRTALISEVVTGKIKVIE